MQLERYLVTVSQPSRAGNEIAENITVLASSSKAARYMAQEAFRRRHDLAPAITLFTMTPVICPNHNIKAASWA